MDVQIPVSSNPTATIVNGVQTAMYSCVQCSCRYNNLTGIKLHLIVSKQEKGPYSCDYCLFKSCTQKGLNFHYVVTHKVNNQVEIYEVDDEDLVSREAKAGSRSHQENISPLMLAVQNRQLEKAKVLIQMCSNLTEVINPFQFAIKTFQVEMVECFIDNWTSCNLIHQLDRTILNQIVLNRSDDNTNCLKMIDLLSRNCDAFQIDEFYHNDEFHGPLQLAVKRNMLNITKCLLRNGAKVNHGSEESLPIMLATKNDNIEMVKVLLDHGANVNINPLNNVDYVPLFIAIKNDNIEMVKWLLVHGALVDKKAHNVQITADCTPLEYAICLETGNGIRPNNLNIINIIIGHTAKVSANYERSAINFAVHNGRQELLHILFDQGANLNQKDNQDSTPLQRAVERNYESIVKKLIMLGADLNLKNKEGQTPLLLAIANGKEDIARELIIQGANPNLEDDKGNTPLFVALKKKYDKIAKELILHGSDINSKEPCFNYPIILFAIKQKQMEIVKLMIEKGTNLQEKRNGDPILKIAKEVSTKEHFEVIVRQLIKTSESKAKKEEPSAKRFKLGEDCVICYNPRNGIFVMTPCGHAKTCEICCMKIMYLPESNSKCPVCRINVESYIKAFF